MDEEFIIIQIQKNSLVITKKIKRMATEFIFIKIKQNLQENIKTMKKKEQDIILINKEIK